MRSIRRVAAFTLIELLVAAGITALLAGLSALLLRNLSVASARASNRLGTEAQARVILDQLQLDLQGALFRDDGNVWLAVDVLNDATGGATGLWQSASGHGKPVGGISLDLAATRPHLRADERGRLEHARFGTAGVWLRFLTSSHPLADAAGAVATPAAPAAVGYQIIRRFTASNPANPNTAYLLHRAEVRPAALGNRPGVLESGYDLTAAAYTTGVADHNTGAVTGDPCSIQVPGAARALECVLGDNVVDFGIRCYVRDRSVSGGLRLIFPATAQGDVSDSATARLRAALPARATVEEWGGVRPFPDVIDVMVRILTDEGAALIASIERSQTSAVAVPAKYNDAHEWWWGIAQEHSHVYTRRIALNAGSI